MNAKLVLFSVAAGVAAVAALAWPAPVGAAVQVGASGKTYASSAVTCAADPITNQLTPMVEAGLFNPKRNTRARVSLNGAIVATVTTRNPAADVWLADGATNTVVVALSKKSTDRYQFIVPSGMCSLPDTSGNTFSPDGTLEYAASGKSYATATSGCALNPATGLEQPFVNLFDNGGYLLDVSVNGVPLTQLSASHPLTPVFLDAGSNVISAANGSLSVDWYIRDGGAGVCSIGNTFSSDGTLEFGASGKSYATVNPGCAWNPAAGRGQPFVNLFDSGDYLLNVSVNGVPLTQLSTRKPHTPVFLGAGLNVISAANGLLSIDYYYRDGGDGSCMLP
jgi:hypothetical protein